MSSDATIIVSSKAATHQSAQLKFDNYQNLAPQERSI
jgi:hypothetical protein